LAIEEINKVVLQPGEVFSFNKTVGPGQRQGVSKGFNADKKKKRF
jgi:vancomycin resistance protein YoaR